MQRNKYIADLPIFDPMIIGDGDNVDSYDYPQPQPKQRQLPKVNPYTPPVQWTAEMQRQKEIEDDRRSDEYLSQFGI